MRESPGRWIGSVRLECVRLAIAATTRFSDIEHAHFQSRLVANPHLGTLIRGGGGSVGFAWTPKSGARVTGARVTNIGLGRRSVTDLATRISG